MSSKKASGVRKRPTRLLKGTNPRIRKGNRVGWAKDRDSGLRLALRAAGMRAGGPPVLRIIRGKQWLAEGLGVKVQSINNWVHIPKDRLMMVHMLTGVPLAKLEPQLFGRKRSKASDHR